MADIKTEDDLHHDRCIDYIKKVAHRYAFSKPQLKRIEQIMDKISTSPKLLPDEEDSKWLMARPNGVKHDHKGINLVVIPVKCYENGVVHLIYVSKKLSENRSAVTVGLMPGTIRCSAIQDLVTKTIDDFLKDKQDSTVTMGKLILIIESFDVPIRLYS